jgi:hypothetical protein
MSCLASRLELLAALRAQRRLTKWPRDNKPYQTGLFQDYGPFMRCLLP